MLTQGSKSGRAVLAAMIGLGIVGGALVAELFAASSVAWSLLLAALAAGGWMAGVCLARRERQLYAAWKAGRILAPHQRRPVATTTGTAQLSLRSMMLLTMAAAGLLAASISTNLAGIYLAGALSLSTVTLAGVLEFSPHWRIGQFRSRALSGALSGAAAGLIFWLCVAALQAVVGLFSERLLWNPHGGLWWLSAGSLLGLLTGCMVDAIPFWRLLSAEPPESRRIPQVQTDDLSCSEASRRRRWFEPSLVVPSCVAAALFHVVVLGEIAQRPFPAPEEVEPIWEPLIVMGMPLPETENGYVNIGDGAGNRDFQDRDYGPTFTGGYPRDIGNGDDQNFSGDPDIPFLQTRGAPADATANYEYPDARLPNSGRPRPSPPDVQNQPLARQARVHNPVARGAQPPGPEGGQPQSDGPVPSSPPAQPYAVTTIHGPMTSGVVRRLPPPSDAQVLQALGYANRSGHWVVGKKLLREYIERREEVQGNQRARMEWGHAHYVYTIAAPGLINETHYIDHKHQHVPDPLGSLPAMPAEQEQLPWQATLDKAITEAADGNKHVLMLVLHPIYGAMWADAILQKWLGEQFIVVYVSSLDVDDALKIRSVPEEIVISPQGRIVARLNSTDSDEIRGWALLILEQLAAAQSRPRVARAN